MKRSENERHADAQWWAAHAKELFGEFEKEGADRCLERMKILQTQHCKACEKFDEAVKIYQD